MMVPTIEPTVIIPVGKSLHGNASFVQLQFAGDPPALFVYESTSDYPWYRVVQWHAPTIAAVVMLLVFAAVVVKAWRVWRRPMADGLLYCRGCNHELGAPNAERSSGGSRWMNEQARCPECGVRSEKAPRVGVSGWKRLRLTLAVSALLIAAGATTLGLTLTPYPSAWRFGIEPTWPVDGLMKKAGIFTLMRKMSSTDRIGIRISRIDIPSGGKRELVTVWKPGWIPLFVSDDGRWVVTSDGRRREVLLLIDAANGDRREVRLPIKENRYAQLVAFSTDSKRAYLSSSDWLSRERAECTVFCLELETGDLRPIDQVEVKHPADWLGSTSAGSAFAVRDDEQGLSWVHRQMYQKAGGRLDVFRRLKGDDIEEIEFRDASGSIADFARLSKNRDVVEFHGFYQDRPATFDLKSRTFMPAGMGGVYLPKRRYLNWPENGLRVRDWVQKEPVAILAAPLSDSPRATPQLSSDGRWLAAFLSRSTVPRAPGTVASSSGAIHEIRVWDLSRIPDAPPAAAPASAAPEPR
jgi:hypothetical protein